MKSLLIIAVTAIAMASFATSTFAQCSGSSEGGEKSKDKTAESAQS